MSKFIIVCAAALLLFSSGIKLNSKVFNERQAADVTSNASKIEDKTGAVEPNSNGRTGSKRGDDWPDKRARFRAEIIEHTVKISENIKYKDISGNESVVEDATSGSGSVVAVDEDRNKSLVLTASHVCEDGFSKGDILNLFIGSIMISHSEKKIIALSGKAYDARVVFDNPVDDVCIMEADGIVGTPAVIGAGLTEKNRGARVYTAGAPAGIWDEGVTNVEEGLFAGFRKTAICRRDRCLKNYLQFSIPLVGGMSGSGIYYKGEIVSIVTTGTGQYEHVGWGPGINPIKESFDEGLAYWEKEVEKEREAAARHVD